MLILKYLDSSLDIEVRETLLVIQQLAQQIVCYYEDMDCPEARTNLLRLPIRLLPEPALDLITLFHKRMVRDHLWLQIESCLPSEPESLHI